MQKNYFICTKKVIENKSFQFNGILVWITIPSGNGLGHVPTLDENDFGDYLHSQLTQ